MAFSNCPILSCEIQSKGCMRKFDSDLLRIGQDPYPIMAKSLYYRYQVEFCLRCKTRIESFDVD
jgi:hypothetical protein